MADRYRDSPRSVRLSQDDHEWLAELAQDEDISIHALVKRAVQHLRYWQDEGEEALKEALEIFDSERSGRENERRRRLYYQRELDLQSRRLHNQLRDERNLRAKYETQLRDERNLRVKREIQLRDEHNLRAKRETQLRDERDYYERQARAAAQAHGNVLHSPTVAKLLTLAIRSESDAEAMTAVAKARALHRKEQDSMSDTP